MTLRSRWVGIFVVGAGAVLLGACSATGDDDGTIGVFQLAEGMCFDEPEAAAQTHMVEVVVVDCDQPHAREVYARFDLAEVFTHFPGAAVVEDAATQRCAQAFEDYVGERYPASDLFARLVMPTEDTWEQRDRSVVCYLFDPRGPRGNGARDQSG